MGILLMETTQPNSTARTYWYFEDHTSIMRVHEVGLSFVESNCVVLVDTVVADLDG